MITLPDVPIQREHAAQHVRVLRGVTEDDDADSRRRLVIRNAAETGSHCAKCERELGPTEPVWRVPLSFGSGPLGGWRSTTAPLCKKCKPKRSQFSRPRPCCGCGRLVHNEWNNIRRRYTFCSATCARGGARYLASIRRAEARGRRE